MTQDAKPPFETESTSTVQLSDQFTEVPTNLFRWHKRVLEDPELEQMWIVEGYKGIEGFFQRQEWRKIPDYFE